MEFLVIISICSILATTAYSNTYYNVMDYGAVGNGNTDDSQAFSKAWEAVCEATSSNATLYVPPERTFLLTPITFKGPCKSFVFVKILGEIVAPGELSAWKGHDPSEWINFGDINGLKISGNGSLDGKGSIWWKSCPKMKGCERPTTLKFEGVTNFQLKGLTLINSGRNHISVSDSKLGTISYVKLFAPAESPNTDGIDISYSTNIQVLYSTIGTGDDCIAINTGTSFVNITGVACGPGHGISVGSLGKNGEVAEVEEIHVKSCSFNGTTNGARIKTWQGGRGYARKITFEDIKLFRADNPIIIDQYYCNTDSCNNQSAAVQVSDVSFVGFKGTSLTADAINLSCSKTVACTNIFVEDVIIKSSAGKSKGVSSCINARGKTSGLVIPPIECLSE